MSGAGFTPFETVPDAILVVGRDGSIVHANAHADRLFGYEHGRLVGLTLDSLIPQKHRKPHAQFTEKFFAEPTARPMGTGRELRALRSDGREFPVEIAIGPTEDSNCVVTVIRDISATVRTRDELRHSEERFRVAAASTADLIWETDILAETVDWFGDIDGLLGYDPGSFPRTLDAWVKSIHPDDRDQVNRLVERIVETGADFHARYRVRHTDGTYRHWEDRAQVTGWVDGKGNTIVGSITDITDRVVAEQKLEQALSQVQLLKERLEAESHYLQKEIKSSHNFDEIVGNSVAMMATLYKVEQVAETDASVLLLGETGTGKELLARAIHARSSRKGRPLIKVDCTTLPPGLVESELFGHEKGAFTGAHEAKPGRFELADSGTVFLDEIGDLPLELQTKLLRVIQDGEFQRLGAKRVQCTDVRIIAATNRNLHEEMRAGRFRSDLYYRIGVFPIEVPPLRDRREDVPLLAAFLVTQRSRKLGKNVTRVPKSVMNTLMAYDWPGNVRELQNVIERGLILSSGSELELMDSLAHSQPFSHDMKGSFTRDLRGIERKQILEVLEASRWKIKGEGNAASRLGLKPSTLRSRMRRLDIERPD